MNKIFDSIKAYFILIFANPTAWGMGLAFLLVYIFFEKSEVSEKEVQQYIQNSDIIALDNFEFIDHELHKTYTYSFFKRRNSNGFKSKEYIVIKDLKRNKYFELDYYDGVRFFSFQSEDKMPEKFYILVNKQDSNTPELGTHKKPIHVLLFYTNEKYKNYYITESQYLINVKEYLSYDR